MTEFLWNQNSQLRDIVVRYPFLFENKAAPAATNADYLAKCGYASSSRLSCASVGFYGLDVLEKYKDNFLFGRPGASGTVYEFTFYLGDHTHLITLIQDVPSDMGTSAAPKVSRFAAGAFLWSLSGERIKSFIEDNREFEIKFQKPTASIGFLPNH
jgi:hypothetical protein